MCKYRVRLETTTDVKEFVKLMTSVPEEVYLEDDANHRVNAKSLLGCLYSLEFETIWLLSDNPIKGIESFTY